MSDNPYMTGFESEIVDVHFGSGPFCVIWCDKFHDKGPAFNTSATINVFSSSLRVPARGTIIQPLPVLSGQGAPSGSVPITDAITSKMKSAYESWIGANQTFNDFGTPADLDLMGYMVFNMGKGKKNTLTFDLTYSSGSGGGPVDVVVATYKKLNSVAYRHNFVSGSDFEGLTVVTPTGSDFVGDNDGFFDPALAPRALGFAGRTTSSLSKSWHVTVNPDTLAVSMSA